MTSPPGEPFVSVKGAEEPDEFFTLHILHNCIDSDPFLGQWEVDRLAHWYRTYRTKAYRAGYLEVLLDGTAHAEKDEFKKRMLVERALGHRKKPYDELTPQQKGKLSQEHSHKLRTLAFRVLFLRELFESGPDGVRRKKIIMQGGVAEKMTYERISIKLTKNYSYLREAPDAEAIRKMCRFR